MERGGPYLLPLELARGTLVQVRNQLSDWQVIGLSVPAAVTAKLTEAVAQFSWAVVVTRKTHRLRPNTPRRRFASAVIAGDMLAAAYAEQALAGPPPQRRRTRQPARRRPGHHPAGQPHRPAVLADFNAAEVPLSLARRGDHRRPLLLEHLRQADRVVPRRTA